MKRLRSGEAAFSSLSLPFRRTGERLRIDGGTLRGSQVGGTLDGTLALDARQLDLSGTFVPLFVINNLFGQLPLIGGVLGGAEEGLFGINYQVTGSFQEPKLTVNPLSAIAPGILRDLFE